MFCSKCGTQIPDGSAFCGNCGNPLTPEQAPAQQTSAPQQPAPQPTPAQQPIATAPTPSFEKWVKAPVIKAPSWTKWVKALMIIVLLLGMISSIVMWFTIKFGLIHGLDVSEPLDYELFYRLYPKVETLDMIFGYIYLFLAIMQIMSGGCLISRRSKYTPANIMSIIAIVGVVTPIYAFEVKEMVNLKIEAHDKLVTGAIIFFVVHAITFVLSKLYFDKCTPPYIKVKPNKK